VKPLILIDLCSVLARCSQDSLANEFQSCLNVRALSQILTDLHRRLQQVKVDWSETELAFINVAEYQRQNKVVKRIHLNHIETISYESFLNNFLAVFGQWVKAAPMVYTYTIHANVPQLSDALLELVAQRSVLVISAQPVFWRDLVGKLGWYAARLARHGELNEADYQPLIRHVASSSSSQKVTLHLKIDIDDTAFIRDHWMLTGQLAINPSLCRFIEFLQKMPNLRFTAQFVTARKDLIAQERQEFFNVVQKSIWPELDETLLDDNDHLKNPEIVNSLTDEQRGRLAVCLAELQYSVRTYRAHPCSEQRLSELFSQTLGIAMQPTLHTDFQLANKLSRIKQNLMPDGSNWLVFFDNDLEEIRQAKAQIRADGCPFSYAISMFEDGDLVPNYACIIKNFAVSVSKRPLQKRGSLFVANPDAILTSPGQTESRECPAEKKMLLS